MSYFCFLHKPWPLISSTGHWTSLNISTPNQSNSQILQDYQLLLNVQSALRLFVLWDIHYLVFTFFLYRLLKKKKVEKLFWYSLGVGLYCDMYPIMTHVSGYVLYHETCMEIHIVSPDYCQYTPLLCGYLKGNFDAPGKYTFILCHPQHAHW